MKSYEQVRRRPVTKTPAQKQQQPAAPGPSMDALRDALSQPSAEQLGHRIDLLEAMRAKMEASFGTDLSAIRLYESQAVADAGAQAITRGRDIAFAPDQLDLTSYGGQALLGHELSHAVSQARGEVRGSGFLDNQALESRADREGAMAAAGQQVYTGPVTSALSNAAPGPMAAGPMQAKRTDPEEVLTEQRRQHDMQESQNVTAAQMTSNGYENWVRNQIANEASPERRAALRGDRSNLTELSADGNFMGKLIGIEGTRMQQRVEAQNQAMPALQQNGKFSRGDLTTTANVLAPDTKTMMDPVVRHALATSDTTGIHDQELREALGDEMDRQVIAASMKKLTNEQKGALGNNAEEISKAEQSGRDLAHMLLSMHLGKVNIRDKEGGPTHDYGTLLDANNRARQMSYDPSMAALLAHGGRVNMDFGAHTGDQKTAHDVYRSMMELDSKDIAGLNNGQKDALDKSSHKAKTHRKLATHRLAHVDGGLDERHGDASAVTGLQSSKLAGMMHRGFNPALGGAGKLGIRSDNIGNAAGEWGHIIKSNGQNGHVYLGVKDSLSGKDHGGMMVGMETSGSGQKNLLGKTHDAKAVKSPYSAVGGLKQSDATAAENGRGMEYNGRDVDLTGYSTDAQVTLHQMFTERLANLSGDDATYNDIMEKLSGSKLSPDALAAILVGDGDDEASKAKRTMLKAVITQGQAGGKRG